MSIKKLLGTGACMVILGVSAGTSYGLIQRMTQQASAHETAHAAATPVSVQADEIASAQFVAAGVTAWTPPEKSNVTVPDVSAPASFDQPESPLLEYTSVLSDTGGSVAPVLPLYAHIDETIIQGSSPAQAEVEETPSVADSAPAQAATPGRTNPAREVIVASAPRELVTPGTLRRFRSTGEDQSSDASDGEGAFEQNFPPRVALKPARPFRPSAERTSRAVERSARFRQTWATGVYR